MVEGRANFPSKGSMKGSMPFIWQRPFGVITGAVRFIFCFKYYFGDSAAYFLEISMLISLKGTLT